MINNLNILLPEIFLATSTMAILMIGVFNKNSYNLVTKLSLIIILSTTFILFHKEIYTIKIFSEMFISNPFTIFIKILLLVAGFFVLNSSQQFIKDNKIDKFEYPIIVLISILGMFFMVSSNN